MSRAILLMVFCGVTPAMDLNIPQLLYFRYKDISKQFLKMVEFDRPKSISDSPILYGHPRYGFFSVRPQFISDRKIRVELIPPGYRFPIRFYAHHPRHGWQLFASRHFKSPVPAFFDALQGIAAKGRLSTVFLSLTPGMPTYKNTASRHKDFNLDTVTVVNRLGEIVWLHLPRIGAKREAERASLAKPIDKGLMAVLVFYDHFETVDFKGRVRTQFRFERPGQGSKLDHDFIQLPSGEFLAIGTGYKFIRFPRPEVPIISFEEPQGYKRTPLLSRPRKIRFNLLVKFDPFSSVQSRALWRSIDALSPHRIRDSLATQGTPTSGLSIDFSHANSLEYRAGEGFLVSLGKQDRLVLLDEAFNLKWTIGPSPHDTYHFPIPLRGFRFQHDANRLPNGNILIMDNLGRSPNRSQILELRLDPARGLITEKIFTPELPLVLGGRGGARRLPNGNTLGYFPSPFLTDELHSEMNHPSPWHYLIEFDQKTGREVAQVKFVNSFNASQAILTGYRAEPLDAIGLESYAGDELPR